MAASNYLQSPALAVQACRGCTLGTCCRPHPDARKKLSWPHVPVNKSGHQETMHQHGGKTFGACMHFVTGRAGCEGFRTLQVLLV